MSDIESKYFVTVILSLLGEILDAKIKEKGLVDKSANAGFIDNSDLSKKIAILATKAELKS